MKHGDEFFSSLSFFSFFFREREDSPNFFFEFRSAACGGICEFELLVQTEKYTL